LSTSTNKQQGVLHLQSRIVKASVAKVVEAIDNGMLSACCLCRLVLMCGCGCRGGCTACLLLDGLAAAFSICFCWLSLCLLLCLLHLQFLLGRLLVLLPRFCHAPRNLCRSLKTWCEASLIDVRMVLHLACLQACKSH
jgi:hypothetical protein